MNKYNIEKLLEIIFDTYNDIRIKTRNIGQKTIRDCVISAIAMYHLKFPSLLQYELSKNEAVTLQNLRTLYRVTDPPSDTWMREVLDEVDPQDIRGGFKQLFKVVQKGKKLKLFRYYEDFYLLSLDGTGHYSSSKISCQNCCQKEHKNGQITYHHNMMGAAIVSPEIKAVIPICPEPILKQDGKIKNDCEMNASTRLLDHYRREHPHLKTIVLQDALAAKAPHIRHLESLKLSYIIGVKSSDHVYMFKEINASDETRTVKDLDGKTVHRFRYLNGVSLNKSNKDLKVNYLEYIQIEEGKEPRYFSWITDQVSHHGNLYTLMRAARSRWKIENETFNTLKNQGYQAEHNFGHGKKNLCTIFSFLMMLAFLMDQIQLIGSFQFKKALAKTKSKIRLWFKMRSLFTHLLILSWNDLFKAIAFQHQLVILVPDTS